MLAGLRAWVDGQPHLAAGCLTCRALCSPWEEAVLIPGSGRPRAVTGPVGGAQGRPGAPGNWGVRSRMGPRDIFEAMRGPASRTEQTVHRALALNWGHGAMSGDISLSPLHVGVNGVHR